MFAGLSCSISCTTGLLTLVNQDDDITALQVQSSLSLSLSSIIGSELQEQSQDAIDIVNYFQCVAIGKKLIRRVDICSACSRGFCMQYWRHVEGTLDMLLNILDHSFISNIKKNCKNY